MEDLLEEIGKLVAQYARGGWCSLYISKRESEPVWIALFDYKGKGAVAKGAKEVAKILEGEDETG